jgi:hypothetical protein
MSTLLAVAAMFALAASPASADVSPAPGGPPIVSGSGAPQGNGASGAHVVHCANIPNRDWHGVRVHVVATNEHHGGSAEGCASS